MLAATDESTKGAVSFLRGCTTFACLMTSMASPRCFLGESFAAQAKTDPVAGAASGQEQNVPEAPSAQQEPLTISGLPGRVLRDEVHLVTFPHHTTRADVPWLIPLAAATTVAFGLDEKTMSEVVSTNQAFNETSRNVSDGLRDGFIAVPVAMLGVGALTHNEHTRETGFLGSEAMIDAYATGELIKLATFRERPYVDHAEGSFYRLSAGTDSSFISGHTLVAWSSAAVLAQEYPGTWRRTAIYSLATGVSLTRVLGQEHFPSDALLGSAVGWLIGHYVYKARHRITHIRSDE